ncbi:MAG: acyclic terpene utilization AtuA family protein [Rhodococcus sp. (in: high G+C Gram-positive bacteria)]
MSTAPRRPVKVANCSGFYGDRMSALAEVVRGGEIDVVTGDYLAEVTMLVLAKGKLKSPDAGYAVSFLGQVEPVLDEIADRGIKVVVNAGGLNPAGLAEQTRGLVESKGLDLVVAHIEGDDLIPQLSDLEARGQRFPNLDTGEPLSTWGTDPLTANAYLGGWGVVAALRGGADIVICGRVTDASVVVGAAAWWHDWAMDSWNELAGAVVAGHIIECGTQATGGNFSGFAEIDDLWNLGFPIAEIDANGDSVITKHPDTGGAVTVDTCTAQLVYEIQGVDYLNPDVTTRLDSFDLRQVDLSRVSVTGVVGAPPPPTTKVSITGLGGHNNSGTFALTGLDIEAKADLVRRTLERRFADDEGVEELLFDLVGHPADDPADQAEGTTLLRVGIRGDEASVGRRFFSALVELGLSSYPGLYMMGSDARRAHSYGVYWPATISQDVLDHRAVFSDGSIERVAVPPTQEWSVRPGEHTPEGSRDWGSCVRAPLGSIAYARSGDKGGNANVGIWVKDDDAYEWLRGYLTVDRLVSLLPEARGLAVDRAELANLRALNFVVRGLLGGGATETMRLDGQAKALGEYVRSKYVEIPRALIAS